MRPLFTLFLLLVLPVASQSSTEGVYARYRDTVLQVKIVDVASGAKASIGSGFMVSADGLVVTNYHVVAELIHQPGRYRAEYIRGDAGGSGPLQLLDIDVVHDLALLRGAKLTGAFLRPRLDVPAKGERLFAFGNPHDLGLTIVEGTCNGLLEDSLYDKIHFTGAINAGMSGGPVIDGRGAVVGVNVASGGNQLGFLVPARHVAALLKGSGGNPAEPLLERVRSQLLANQDRYMRGLLGKPFVTEKIKGYDLPARLAPFLKCWGDSRHEPDNLYDQVVQTCASDDDIFLTRQQATGGIRFRHDHYSSADLGPVRFYGLMERQFNKPDFDPDGDEKSVANFVCTSDLVAGGGSDVKVVFCLRPYKKLKGLFDAYLSVATLAGRDQALQSSLLISGVSDANALAFARSYLEAIRWNP
ncbi:MAG TPA: peptidase S1 [Desulfuromonas sp.]|nr:peptidase S1 [Desulfuromonas sp.]